MPHSYYSINPAWASFHKEKLSIGLTGPISLHKIILSSTVTCYVTTVSGTGQDLYDDVVSARRSMPATIGM